METNQNNEKRLNFFEKTMETIEKKHETTFKNHENKPKHGTNPKPCKGTYHLRFSGIRPLRGYPPLPSPLNGKSV